jgi:hypothetical protein
MLSTAYLLYYSFNGNDGMVVYRYDSDRSFIIVPLIRLERLHYLRTLNFPSRASGPSCLTGDDGSH